MASGMNRPGIRPAPLVDVPVVIGPDHRCGVILVVAGHEELTARYPARTGSNRGQHAIDVHVLDPLRGCRRCPAGPGRSWLDRYPSPRGAGLRRRSARRSRSPCPRSARRRCRRRGGSPCGTRSLYLPGTWSRKKSLIDGGSTTWSSTLMSTMSSICIRALPSPGACPRRQVDRLVGRRLPWSLDARRGTPRWQRSAGPLAAAALDETAPDQEGW